MSDKERELEKERKRQEQIDLLTSRNFQVRAKAVKRLGELNGDPGLILPYLDDADGSVRAAAAGALGDNVTNDLRLGVIDALLGAIDDPNDRVCSAAIGSLGRLRVEEARKQIVDCLPDPNPRIIKASILALARINYPGDAERLLSFTDHTNVWVRQSAIRAMGITGYQQAIPSLIASLEEYLETHVGKDTNAILLRTYVETLGELNSDEAVPLLCRIVKYEVGVRSTAIEVLVGLDADEVIPVLLDMLGDPGSSIRKSILSAFLHFDYRPGLPLIRPWLQSDNDKIRRMALGAVVDWHDQGAIEFVREMCFNDPNPYLRPEAIFALTSLAGPDAIADLVELADDPNVRVRKAVVQSLAKMSTLNEDGLEALRKLSLDVYVGSLADEVLNGYADTPLTETHLPAGAATQASPIPEAIIPNAVQLLGWLEQWQEALGTDVRYRKSADLLDLDTALTTLIQQLRPVTFKTDKDASSL